MRQFIFKVAIFVSVNVTLLSLLIGRYYDPARDLAFYAPANAKHELLQEAPSPRVLLVGGSNVYFGIQSELIAEETDYHPINMGLIAGLRLEYTLAELYDGIRAGDLVLLCFEYPQMTTSYGDSPRSITCLARLLCARPETVGFWAWPHWRSMLDSGAAEALGESSRKAFSNFLRAVRGKDLKPTVAITNEFGDLLTHRDKEPRPNRPPAFNSNALARQSIDRQAALVNRFVQHCEARGATVVFTFPPVPEDNYQGNEQVLADHAQRLRDALDCPVVQDPADMVFPNEWFYDTSYHLTGPGVPARTRKLIEIIHRYPPATPAP